MSLRKDNTGLAGPASLTEQIYVKDSTLVDRLQAVIAVLVEKLDGDVFLSNESIEDAPELLLASNFERDGVELRTGRSSV